MKQTGSRLEDEGNGGNGEWMVVELEDVGHGGNGAWMAVEGQPKRPNDSQKIKSKGMTQAFPWFPS